MTDFKITDNTGTVHVIPFPETLDEFSLNQKIAFDVTYEHSIDWMNKQVDEGTFGENRMYFLYLLSRSISEFLEYDLNEVLKFDVSDLLDENSNLSADKLTEHFQSLNDAEFEHDYDNTKHTLLSIAAYIYRLVNSYKHEFPTEKDHRFQHNGKFYTIPYQTAQLFSGRRVFSGVSVQQAVETIKVKNYLAKSQKNKANVTLQDQMDERFESFLRLIAVTSTKLGETAPLDDTEFNKYIDERIPLFANISYGNATSAIFFLTSTMKSSKNKPN